MKIRTYTITNKPSDIPNVYDRSVPISIGHLEELEDYPHKEIYKIVYYEFFEYDYGNLFTLFNTTFILFSKVHLLEPSFDIMRLELN
jgi:hypothetical protein